MRDINKEAEKALSALPYRVVYYYPESFNDLPVISYYNLTETGAFASDNQEDIQQGTAVVDIWADNPKQCGSIGIEVYNAMTADGWVREFSGDIPPEDKKNTVFHRTMRFVKDFIN